MTDIGDLFQGLPEWVQTGIVVIVLIVGAVIGVKAPKRGATKRLTPRARSRAGSTRDGVHSGDPRLLDASPGQSGPDATTDLPASALATLKLSYAPEVDGTPDPGEVVWTWVPFVENDGRGKDRPVLVIGRLDAHTVAGCYLSTREHRGFVYVGPGRWDAQGRPSYLNPERILRITDGGMRREGAIVDRSQFETVVKALVAHHRR